MVTPEWRPFSSPTALAGRSLGGLLGPGDSGTWGRRGAVSLETRGRVANMQESGLKGTRAASDGSATGLKAGKLPTRPRAHEHPL